MPDELEELQEDAERAKENRKLAPVSLTMAALAVLVALASLLGHRAHTEEVVLQGRASDQWSHYQSKDTRQHIDQLFSDLTAVQATGGVSAVAKLREKYLQEAFRYQNERRDLEAEARRLETEVAIERNRADRFDLAEVFLEIGLVITSITLLSGRRIFWAVGIVLAVLGIVAAATGFFVR